MRFRSPDSMTTTSTTALLACLVAGCAGFAATGDPMAPDPAAQASTKAEPPAAEPAPAIAVGQPVLARFRGGKFWFAGRVESIGGGTVAVAYLDGSREQLSEANVRPFDWQVGTRVECNWRGQGFYAGTIVAVDGRTGAEIAYEDGTREPIDIAFCRAR